MFMIVETIKMEMKRRWAYELHDTGGLLESGDGFRVRHVHSGHVVHGHHHVVHSVIVLRAN